jgi:cytochrome c-type biogenesis protein CcmH
VKAATYFLWFGPFVLLLAGLFVLFRYLRQRRQLITEQPLSADQRRDAEALLQPPNRKEIA